MIDFVIGNNQSSITKVTNVFSLLQAPVLPRGETGNNNFLCIINKFP